MGTIYGGERQLDGPQLNGHVAAAARGFAALGIKEGDAVALLLRNDFAFFEASFAAQHLGAFAVPINWHNAPDEVAYVLVDSAARVLVAHADLYHRHRETLPAGLTVLIVPVPADIADAYKVDPSSVAVPDGGTDWFSFINAHADGALLPARAAPSPMIYTSGTTGKPKGVRRLPGGDEVAAFRAIAAAQGYGLRPGFVDVVLMNGPMYHTAPNSYGLAAAGMGADIVLQPRFDAEQMLTLIERYRVTHMHIVPTMFVRLLRLPDDVRSRYDLSSLRFVVHGAAPCPTNVKRQMIEWWGQIIHEYYGATETGLIAAHGSAEALERPGTVGKAIEGVEIRIVDDQDADVAPGEIGRIFAVSRAMSDFTYHGRHAEREEVGLDRFVTVGDVGYRDADGYIYLCDRARDMIISGGVNIYPAEIEAVLLQVAGVRDCAVFGIPDEEYGESVCAWIEAGEEDRPDRQSVLSELRKSLARYKLPRVIEFTSSLPREDSGKIFKRRLRQPYWDRAIPEA